MEASFGQFNDVHLAFLDQLTQSIGIVLNTIAATMRTEQLLQQSQALAEELRSQQLQLQTTNAELQEKAQLLAEQKTEVETKNLEVEQAKKALDTLPIMMVLVALGARRLPVVVWRGSVIYAVALNVIAILGIAAEQTVERLLIGH